MKTKCPWCGQCYEVEEEDVGQIACCDQCGREFTAVPFYSASPSSSSAQLPQRKYFVKSFLTTFLAMVLLFAAGFAVKKVMDHRRNEANALAAQARINEEKEQKRLAEEKKLREAAEQKERERLQKAAEFKAAIRQKEVDFQKQTQETRCYLESVKNHSTSEAPGFLSDSLRQSFAQEVQSIQNAEKRDRDALASLLGGTIPKGQVMNAIEAFPEPLRSDVAQIVVCKAILERKPYPDRLLTKMPDAKILDDPRVYAPCSLCKGSGLLHCVSCKDTRVCQQCYGKGKRTRKFLRNNVFEYEVVPCPTACQFCEGKPCRKCGGKAKMISPELGRRINDLSAETREKIRQFYQAKMDVIPVRESAAQGNPAAQFELGERFSKGNGVVQDADQAVFWYRKAAEQEYAKAQNALAKCYENGTGVAKDAKQAAYWHHKAAE